MKHKKAAYILTLTVILSASLFTGCGSAAGATSAEASTQADEPQASAEASSEAAPEDTESPDSGRHQADDTPDPDTLATLKYNSYVQLNNSIVEVLDCLDYYDMVVADQDDFALLEDSQYSYGYKITGFDSSVVDDALAMSDTKPAYEKLDSLTKQLVEPMKNLMETFSEINSQTDFTSDQEARPEEWHSVIRANREAFTQYAFDFFGELRALEEERIAADEEQLKEDGDLIAYNARHTLTLANQIVRECSAQGINDSNLTELDLTKIRPLYEELADTVAAYNAAASDPEQLAKESLKSSPFDGSFPNLVEAVEWMIGQVESQTPLDNPSADSLGSLNHVNIVLSGCVDDYNDIFLTN